jgi:hypothetical protein
MRRPDDTGGPLAENERIDDIQFYVDPRAEVFIDDIVLYEAAAESETRPFPKRIIFTGWFDTGKQGKEWPGKFDIVEHAKPRQWKFAQSVIGDAGQNVLSVSLRGERTLDSKSEITLLMRSDAAKSLAVQLRHRGRKVVPPLAIALKNAGEWEPARLRLDLSESIIIDEIHVTCAEGTFGIDDLLIYTP